MIYLGFMSLLDLVSEGVAMSDVGGRRRKKKGGSLMLGRISNLFGFVPQKAFNKRQLKILITNICIYIITYLSLPHFSILANSSSPGHPAPSGRPSRSPPSPRPWPRSPSRTTPPSGPPESRATRSPSAPSERLVCKRANIHVDCTLHFQKERGLLITNVWFEYGTEQLSK